MIFPILAALVALSLCTVQVMTFRSAKDFRACIVPAFVCLFAVFVFLIRGEVLPQILPQEIVTIFSYFFSLYLTFSTAIVFTSAASRLKALPWTVAALSAWILAVFA